MTLINKPVQLQVLTAEQQTVKMLQDISLRVYTAIRQALQTGTPLVWKNPSKLTPQQVFSALGTDGGSLVAFNNKLLELMTMAGDSVTSPVPAGTSLSIDASGNVTVVTTPAV